MIVKELNLEKQEELDSINKYYEQRLDQVSTNEKNLNKDIRRHKDMIKHLQD